MAMYNDQFFSDYKEVWSRSDFPLTLESEIIRSNSNSTEASYDNPMKSLLSLDETILNNLEIDNDKVNQNCIENESINESWFNDDLDKSRFADTASQINSDILSRNITADLNNSVSLLKKKLFLTHTNQENSVKRRHIDLSKNDVTPKSFFGLPDKVKNLIRNYKGIDKLYDWQEKCLNMLAIGERKNLIYALPTSGGKTLVAEILMLKEIVCRKKNAMFILPFVALVQEKIQSMTPFALELNFLIEEYAAEKGHFPPRKRRKKNSLYVCTIEKAQTIINCLIELNRLDELGIIVVDELHLLGENGGRGATLECLLTKVIFSERNIQIIGMSATIGNLREIARFLNAELYQQNFRPIEIKEYVQCGNSKWLIDKREENMFTREKIINYQYTEKARERDKDFLGGLVMEVAPKDSCLVFCSTKKNCENVAVLLVDVLKKTEMQKHKAEEKLILLNALITENGQICPILRKTIPFGFAYHHSGLTAEERRLIEEAFKSGVLCVICCTSTLAAGVNLPARRVIIRSPYVGTQFLNISRYKQMIGRAGRAGLGEIGESILICAKTDAEKVRELLSSKMDDSISSLHEEKDRGINNLIISSVLLSVASTRADVHKIMSKTLLKVQEDRLCVSVKEVTDKALVSLLRNHILRLKETNSIKSDSNLDTSVRFPTQIEQNEVDEETKKSVKKTKNIIYLTNSTELELCPLGKAAMKGSIDLHTAEKLYEDLKIAQQNLILDNYLHLLYLITPFEKVSQVKPVGDVYYDTIMKLPPNEMQVAKLLGINEATVIRIRAGMPTSSVSTAVINKFYVTLMLHELWHRRPIHKVAAKYQVDRGTIQNLLSSASSFSSSIVRFCQELDEFWVFKNLLSEFGQKLTYCCAAELEPLMELPFVKIGRAMQLYRAGYQTLQSVAKAKPDEMVDKINHLPRRIVSQIISAAKLLVLKKVENLRDEVEDVLDGLEI
ncbi:helicase POLQ-like isoform X2 [Phymastichus coffea]|uniref:helicase POLQ-like isoform X2 n=1 Tax=Phymastichus coffea TaxID=108790 RepID=UPI00273B282C|nr:helicase POLQ-like isoform X2 [Phymastichus coffea]